MSWLYSRVLVEAYLEDISLDGEQSVQSNGNPIPQAYCAPDKMTAFSRLSRFGMTYKPLTEDRGEELLTLFRAGFPAKTSQPQEKVTDLTEPDRECGERWHAWLAKYDRNSCSWKTPQCSLLGEEQESLATLPRWGMTANGLLWEQPTLEPITRGTESGLWLTPRATDVGKGEKQETFLKRMGDRTDRCAQSLAAQVNNPRTWPTPLTQDSYERSSWKIIAQANEGGKARMTLTRKVKYLEKCPTPIASDSRGSSGRPAPGKQVQLAVAVKKFSTPTRRDYKSGTGAQDRPGHSPPLSNVVGGTLNPTWVEWLMGWPLGWTDLKPLEMDKSHCVPQKPGDC